MILRAILLVLLLHSFVVRALAQPPEWTGNGVMNDSATTATATSETTTSSVLSGQASQKAPAKAAMTERDKIEFLLRRTGQSGNTFIRGRTEYSAEKAESHLRMKLGRAGKRIKTARDFIKYLASASSVTGKPYTIKKLDGTRVPSGQWLTEELEKLEKNAPQMIGRLKRRKGM